MVMADHGDQLLQGFAGLDDLSTECRMRFDHLVFFVRETIWFGEDCLSHPELADVVQQGRFADQGGPFGIHTQFLSDEHRVARHLL